MVASADDITVAKWLDAYEAAEPQHRQTWRLHEFFNDEDHLAQVLMLALKRGTQAGVLEAMVEHETTRRVVGRWISVLDAAWHADEFTEQKLYLYALVYKSSPRFQNVATVRSLLKIAQAMLRAGKLDTFYLAQLVGEMTVLDEDSFITYLAHDPVALAKRDALMGRPQYATDDVIEKRKQQVAAAKQERDELFATRWLQASISAAEWEQVKAWPATLLKELYALDSLGGYAAYYEKITGRVMIGSR